MRAAPIPDGSIWDGSRRLVISPPDGDLTNPDIQPAEALVEIVDGVPCFSFRCLLEDGDLVKLAEGGRVWLTFQGHVVPFSISVVGPDEA